MGIFCNGAVTWICLIGFPIKSRILVPSLNLESASKKIRQFMQEPYTKLMLICIKRLSWLIVRQAIYMSKETSS